MGFEKDSYSRMATGALKRSYFVPAWAFEKVEKF
jgi:hypothetical protein